MGLRGGGPVNQEDSASFDWEVTKRLGRYLKPHRRHLTIALAAMLLSVFASVIGPPIIGFAIDEGIRKNDMMAVIIGVVAYLAVQGAGMLGFRTQIVNMASAGQRVIQKLREELFEHLQHLSLSFFSTYETGRLIARIIGDVNTLREAITYAVVGSIRDFLILVGTVISMLIINPPLTVIALVVMIALAIIANLWRIYARAAYVRVVETNARVNAELAESFNGVRVTQAFDRQDYNYRSFATQTNRNNLDANVRQALIAGLFFPSIDLIGGVATGVLIYIGGTLVLEQNLTVGVLLTFVLYVDQFFFPIRMLAQRYNLFQAVMAAGDKLFTLLDWNIEIQDRPNAIDMPQIRGDVHFKHVSFSYNIGKETVLEDINLQVTAGTTVALVGHTGAGKSTLVKLLMRFYDVTDGEILIDGINISNVTQKSLRRQMGVVLQETHLFAGTVMDNIRYGRLDASDQEVIEAARKLGAHDFIMRLESGYYTEIREGGSLLSAGQRQLIAFARALLADPRILILDEATSNIDTQTEKIIQTALARLLEGRTSFVIAHRLSTITSADCIIVMDHGKIVEVGDHESLLAQEGAYHKLYMMI